MLAMKTQDFCKSLAAVKKSKLAGADKVDIYIAKMAQYGAMNARKESILSNKASQLAFN